MQQLLKAEDMGWWIVSHEGKIWLPKGELPFGTASQWQLVEKAALPIGEWQGTKVWLLNAPCSQQMSSLKQLLSLDKGLFQLAGRGVQLAEFFHSHQYCGYCGHPMQASHSEWACLCQHCHQRYYPQIAPCIIVAIRRGHEILLAKHRRYNSVYTVLAGFVEVGETLEQTAEREIMEESNIKVKNLRYIASQPWPFPHSLMVAFMAEYAGGELCHDPKELSDAQWFRYDQLPVIAPVGTIARRLIEDTIVLCRAEHQ